MRISSSFGSSFSSFFCKKESTNVDGEEEGIGGEKEEIAGITNIIITITFFSRSTHFISPFDSGSILSLNSHLSPSPSRLQSSQFVCLIPRSALLSFFLLGCLSFGPEKFSFSGQCTLFTHSLTLSFVLFVDRIGSLNEVRRRVDTHTNLRFTPVTSLLLLLPPFPFLSPLRSVSSAAAEPTESAGEVHSNRETELWRNVKELQLTQFFGPHPSKERTQEPVRVLSSARTLLSVPSFFSPSLLTPSLTLSHSLHSKRPVSSKLTVKKFLLV